MLICMFDAEDLSSEDLSLLEGAKYFSELKEGEYIEFSVAKVNRAFSLGLISLKEVVMSSSKSQEVLDVSVKKKGSKSMSSLISLVSKESRISSKSVLLTGSRLEVTEEKLSSKDDAPKSILMLDRLGVKEDESSEREKGSP